MKKITTLALTICLHFIVGAQDFGAARTMCENYGFVPNTAPFAQCVQTEVNKSKDTAQDEQLNQACRAQRKQIERMVNQCGLSCMTTRERPEFKLACVDQCDKQLALRPICR
jgi:hypothetical protein